MQDFSISIYPVNQSFLKRLFWFFKKKYFEVSLPAAWHEVAPEKIPAVCKEVMNRESKEVAALNICKLLLNLPDRYFLNIQPIVFVEKILPLINWIFEQPINQPYLNIISHKKTDYVLPLETLKNITWKEFILTDNLYSSVIQTKSADTLNALIAILLREKSNDKNHILKYNDQRVALTEWGSVERAKLFESLEEDVKFYILYFFMGCKEKIHHLYKEAWDSGDAAKKEDLASFEDWDSITTDIAETGIFGNLQELEQTNAHTVLKWLKVKKKRTMRDQAKSIQDQIMSNHKNLLNVRR